MISISVNLSKEDAAKLASLVQADASNRSAVVRKGIRKLHESLFLPRAKGYPIEGNEKPMEDSDER